MHEYKAYLAEAIATFALVFIGAGAILADAGIVGIALAHGLVLMSMIYAIGHVSGGHVNPAVTFSMWVARRIRTLTAIGYIVSQLIGAVIAGFFLKIIFVNTPDILHLGTPALAPSVAFGMGIFIEAILTFFLVFTIFGVTDKRAPPHIGGLAIGLVLTFDILVAGMLTGASMNPARTFGPALASGFWVNHLVYWIGPIAGGILASLLYTSILRGKD